MRTKFLFSIFFVLLFIPFSSALVSVRLADHGTDVRNSTNALVDGGNISIFIYDNETGGVEIFNQTFNGGIVNGSWNVILVADMEYGKTYWKDYSVNGEDLDFSGNERLEFHSPLGYINNETFFNFSLIGSCSSNQAIKQIYENGSVVCADVSSSSTQKSATGYLYNDSTTIYLNETKLNESFLRDDTNSNVGINNFTTTGTGFFSFLGSLASRISNIFVTDVNVNGNITLNGSSVEDWSDVTGSGLNLSGTNADQNINVSPYNLTAGYFIGDGSQLTGISSGSSLWTNSSGDATYTSGNVGIGTTTPGAKLHVAGDGSEDFYVLKSTTDNGNWLNFSTSASDREFVLDSNSITWTSDTTNKFTSLRSGAVSDGSRLFQYRFETTTDGGSTKNQAARIYAEGAGTHSTTNSPGRLVFQTTPNGSTAISTRLLIEENGRIGVATTSPTATLDVRPLNSSTISLSVTSPSGQNAFSIWNNARDTLYLNINENGDVSFQPTTKVTFSDGTNVGIGTGTPSAALEIKRNDTNQQLHISDGESSEGRVEIGYDTSGNYGRFQIWDSTDGAGDITLNPNGGNVGIGTDNASRAKLVIEGNVSYNNGAYGYLNSGGVVGTTGATDVYTSIYSSDRVVANEFNAISDRRVKSEIFGVEDALEVIDKFNVVAYNKATKGSSSRMGEVGLIGQEAWDVYPLSVRISEGDVIDEDGNWVEVGDFYSVNYQTVSMLGIRAIQELRGIIESKDNEIQMLKLELCNKDDSYSWC